MKQVFFIHLILVVLLLNSCEKKRDDFQIEDKAIFEAEVNEEKISLIESDSLTNIDTYINLNPSRQRHHGVRDYVIEVWGLSLGKLLLSDQQPTNHISINFVNHFENWEYDENENISKDRFEDILSKGTKEYSDNYKDFSGVLIEWIDAEGKKWTTSEMFLSGELVPKEIVNKENIFNINYAKFRDDLSNKYEYYQYLDISFQCRLYNSEGHSIMIKNGKLKSTYRLYITP